MKSFNVLPATGNRNWFIQLSLLIILCLSYSMGFGQESREQMMERLLKKLEQYKQQAAGVADIGALTGLWQPTADEDKNDVRQITHYKDVVFYYSVDKVSGNMALHGFAENQNGNWRGWWELACKACCPGVSWWDKAIIVVREGGIQVRAASFKMDPQSCTLTTTPDDIQFAMSLIKTTNFREYLPGKLIHVVAAPAVGSQPAKYKASVTVQWKLQGLGVSHYDFGIFGQTLITGGRQLNGQYEYLTDQPGKITFILVAYNSKNYPMHFEFRTITIPNIPGL